MGFFHRFHRVPSLLFEPHFEQNTQIDLPRELATDFEHRVGGVYIVFPCIASDSCTANIQLLSSGTGT
jgi:hypothetical protein